MRDVVSFEQFDSKGQGRGGSQGQSQGQGQGSMSLLADVRGQLLHAANEKVLYVHAHPVSTYTDSILINVSIHLLLHSSSPFFYFHIFFAAFILPPIYFCNFYSLFHFFCYFYLRYLSWPPHCGRLEQNLKRN